MWNKLYFPVKNTGTIAEVYLNEDKTLIKKIYKVGGITVSGKVTEFTEEQINRAFNNEVHWLKTLKGKWVPELVQVEDNTIVQRYYGADLLENYMRKTLWDDVPNITEQVIEMYAFFKENNVFKRNGSLSNLIVHNDQLIAFDFKWARERPEGIDLEMRSYNEWLSKIDKSLPTILQEMI
jgi:RIO-like serine/threonine protein kinase